MKFVHLKTQSEYSITQGLNRLDDIIDKAKENKIHTCLDTSGFVNIDVIDPILDNTDLVLLDLKHMIEEESKELTGVGVEKSLKLAKHLDERNIPVC